MTLLCDTCRAIGADYASAGLSGKSFVTAIAGSAIAVVISAGVQRRGHLTRGQAYLFNILLCLLWGVYWCVWVFL